MLKLHLVENDANEGSEKNVGNFQFDLKEAIPSAKPLDNPEESYIVVCTCVLYKKIYRNLDTILSLKTCYRLA